jgi:recombination protein RecA
VIFINQIREKIGVMFGNPETTTGGRALKFYSSVRLDIRRTASVKDGEEVTGSRVKVKVVKNKVAPPFREAEFDIMYGSGISTEGDLADMAINLGLIEKSGTWFTLGQERMQGRENLKRFLIENQDVLKDLDQKVRKKVGLIKDETPTPNAAGKEPVKEAKPAARPPAKG